jgi:hypothetical protein
MEKFTKFPILSQDWRKKRKKSLHACDQFKNEVDIMIHEIIGDQYFILFLGTSELRK